MYGLGWHHCGMKVARFLPSDEVFRKRVFSDVFLKHALALVHSLAITNHIEGLPREGERGTRLRERESLSVL